MVDFSSSDDEFRSSTSLIPSYNASKSSPTARSQNARKERCCCGSARVMKLCATLSVIVFAINIVLLGGSMVHRTQDLKAFKAVTPEPQPVPEDAEAARLLLARTTARTRDRERAARLLNDALTAKDEALTAKDEALAAKDEAVTQAARLGADLAKLDVEKGRAVKEAEAKADRQREVARNAAAEVAAATKKLAAAEAKAAEAAAKNQLLETNPRLADALNAMYSNALYPNGGQCYAPVGPTARAMLRRRRSGAPDLAWQHAARDLGRAIEERQFGTSQDCAKKNKGGELLQVQLEVWGFCGILVDFMDNELITNMMGGQSTMIVAGTTPYFPVDSNGGRMDASSSLSWAKGDSTLPCNALFGCYFEPLSKCDAIPNTLPYDDRGGTPLMTYHDDLVWHRKGYGVYDVVTAKLRAFHHTHGEMLLRVAMQAYFYRPVKALRDRINDDVDAIFHDIEGGGTAAATNCVAVHVRRGDQCHDKFKFCPPLAHFINAARVFAKRYDLTSLFLATDDETVIKVFIAQLPHLTVVWNKRTDRSGYAVSEKQDSFGAEASASGKPTFFAEERVARGELSPTPILDVLTEVEAASRCSAFVGDAQSHVGEMMFLKMAWNLGVIPPFYSVRGSLGMKWTMGNRSSAPKDMTDCGFATGAHAPDLFPDEIARAAKTRGPETSAPIPALPPLVESKVVRTSLWKMMEANALRDMELAEERAINQRGEVPFHAKKKKTGPQIAETFCVPLPPPFEGKALFEVLRRFHPRVSPPMRREKMLRSASDAGKLVESIKAQSATCVADAPRFSIPAYGVGAKFTSMLKPWTGALDGDQTLAHFPTPTAPEGGDITRWGLMPLHPRGSAQCGGDAVPPSTLPPTIEMDEETGLVKKNMLSLVPAAYRRKGLFWWVAQSWGWLLRPDPALRAEIDALKASLQWERHRPILAIHVRGGDSCVDGSNSGSGAWRSCSPLSDYLKEAKVMMKLYTFNAIFIATDVDSVLAEARALTKSNALGIPLLTPPQRVSTAKLRENLEHIDKRYEDTVKLGLVNVTTDTREVLRDIHLLSEADGFVGKFSSNVDRIAVALSYGKKQCAIPHTSFDATWCTDFGKPTGKNLENGMKFLC